MTHVDWIAAVVGGVAAFFAWYLLYGLTCFMSGAMGGLEMPFKQLWLEFRYNSPGGRARFVADNRNAFLHDAYLEDLYERYPGPMSMLGFHVLLTGLTFIMVRGIVTWLCQMLIKFGDLPLSS